MSQALARLERIKSRLKLAGKIVFKPEFDGPARYALVNGESIQPLGQKAEAARFMLKKLGGER